MAESGNNGPKEETKDDEIAPLQLGNARVSEINKSPRRMSIQQSVSNVSLQQEEFSAASLMGSATATQSLRINRSIERAYIQNAKSMADEVAPFALSDILENVNHGMQLIVDDDFSLCFKRPERRPWNFNIYLAILWVIGIIIRYLILFPLRLLIMIISILLTMLQFYIWKKLFVADPVKLEKWELWSLQFCIQTILASWGAVIECKGVISSRKKDQIFVCNHTTMLDWLLLMYMRPFCVVGQLQSSRPLVAWFQTELLKSMNCIWFNRSESKDRALAMKRIKDHVADPSKPRLLIFPEGTCVNNEYCIQFKKGAFSLDCEICPVAIKYNPSFIDAYWISRERSFPMHLVDIMTSWAMVAEVHYLEPQTIQKGENAIQFAARTKKMIADAAGLRNVDWNGYLKHYKPSERVIDAQKKLISNSLNALYSEVYGHHQIQSAQKRSSIINKGNNKENKKKRKSVDENAIKE